MKNRVSVFAAAIALSWFGLSMAENDDVKLITSGFAYYQIGQIEKQSPRTSEAIEKPFDQHFNGRFTLSATMNRQLQIIVGAEAEFGANLNDNQHKKDFSLKEAQGIYSFGDPENSYLQIAAGYFPFKYNPEAKNLGEYMYRTGTYPGYVISDFDNAKYRLMGFRASSLLFDALQFHALFTSEYLVHPYFDYSLSFITSLKFPNNLIDFGLPHNLIDIGGGVDFDRIIPIIPEKTTKDQPEYIVRDSLNNPIIENGDTLHFTFKGTKVMARLTLDPKRLLPFADIFGKEDAKLYGEIIFLGLKNYGTEYPDIMERMPVMFGFNVPTLKILDVLSCEAEYYGSNEAQKLDIPTSGIPVPDRFPAGVSRTPWKWSVFAQKTVVKGFAIKGLVGRDHYRPINPNGGTYNAIERMNGPGDWHYKLRIMYSF